MPLDRELRPSQAELCNGHVAAPNISQQEKSRVSKTLVISAGDWGFIFFPPGCGDHVGGRRQGESMEVVAKCWQAF